VHKYSDLFGKKLHYIAASHVQFQDYNSGCSIFAIDNGLGAGAREESLIWQFPNPGMASQANNKIP
jgi:hypothetical protein